MFNGSNAITIPHSRSSVSFKSQNISSFKLQNISSFTSQNHTTRWIPQIHTSGLTTIPTYTKFVTNIKHGNAIFARASCVRHLRACQLRSRACTRAAPSSRARHLRACTRRAPSSKRNEEMMLAPTVEPGKYVVRWDGDIDIVCQCCCLSKSGLNSQPR
jgi:hypothetical protein